MIIHELTADDKGRINEIAALHKRAFPDFFLTKLGVPFLKTLYSGYLEDKDSGIIAAEENGIIIGIIAYSNDYSKFYKGLIKHKIFQFAWCSFLAVLREPTFAKRLFGAFRKSGAVVKNEKYVELASICTFPDMKGKGIGTRLIDYFKSIVDFGEYAYINLETDADNNDAVNQFYIRNGFRLERTYITAEGRRMNEYHYSPGEYV